MSTLGEDLPKEMARVRDKVMPVYRDIGPAGSFALGFMQASLDRATRAITEGDLVAMISAYMELKEYTL